MEDLHDKITSPTPRTPWTRPGVKKAIFMEILRSNGLNLSRFVEIVKKARSPRPPARYGGYEYDTTVRYEQEGSVKHCRIVVSYRIVASNRIGSDYGSHYLFGPGEPLEMLFYNFHETA